MIQLFNGAYRVMGRMGGLSFLLLSVGAASGGQFDVIGTPIKTAMLAASAVGLDEKGNEVLYLDCAQPGSKLFLLQVNPKTDLVRQWNAPIGEGAWAIIVGPDHCIYLGTWESGYLLRFDPKQPDKGIVSLGKPSESETYIWELANAPDQRLYGCTYPGCKLVRYDPSGGKSEDLGRLDPKEMYSRWIAESTNGFVYVAIGTMRGQIVRFDPKSGEKKSLITDSERPATTPHVFRGVDGQVYAGYEQQAYVCDGDKLRSIKSLPAQPQPTFRDGTVVSSFSIQGGAVEYELKSPAGRVVKKSAKFDGAGVRVFVVGAGPGGRIFGSTALPLEMFAFTPASGAGVSPALGFAGETPA